MILLKDRSLVWEICFYPLAEITVVEGIRIPSHQCWDGVCLCADVPEAQFYPVCLLRRMTFGKVNELGQFIREAEPEPDVKKSKGMIWSHFSHPTLCHIFICFLLAMKVMNINLIFFL